MKAKNLFFGALTCLAFAACSDDNDLMNSGGQAEAEKGSAFLAVQLTMPGGTETRADENYVEGKNYEVQVNTAHLFFFNDDANNTSWGMKNITTQIKGDNFASGETNNEPDANGTSGTSGSTDWENGTDKTIDNISPVFIMFENQAIPDYVVAVLNLTDDQANDLKGKNLSDFRKALKANSVNWQKNSLEKNENGTVTKGNFIMSNSVYSVTENETTTIMYTQPLAKKLVRQGEKYTVDGQEVDITAENIREAAKADPLLIPVERVLARVSVDLTTSDNKFAQGKYTGNLYELNSDGTLKLTTDAEIYSVANGWWLDNTNKESYLVKDMENSSAWPNVETSGVDWNDDNNLRSYWANAVNNSETSSNYKFAHYDYSINNRNDKYCYENTNSSVNTQLVVSANLFRKENNSYKTFSMVRHFAQNYTVDAFKAYVLARLAEKYKSDLYYTTNDASTTKAKLSANQLKFVYNGMTEDDNNSGKYVSDLKDKLEPGEGESDPTKNALKDWESIIQLEDGLTVYAGESSTEALTEVNDWLRTEGGDGIGAFQYFNNGKTYYFTPIMHLNNQKGVIRNHLYKITVTSLTGFGTPVPSDDPSDETPKNPEDTEEDSEDPTPEIPDDPEDDPDDPDDDDDDAPDPDDDDDRPIIPETPEDPEVSAIATKIAILQYRVVTNSDVTLENGSGQSGFNQGTGSN